MRSNIASTPCMKALHRWRQLARAVLPAASACSLQARMRSIHLPRSDTSTSMTPGSACRNCAGRGWRSLKGKHAGRAATEEACVCLFHQARARGKQNRCKPSRRCQP